MKIAPVSFQGITGACRTSGDDTSTYFTTNYYPFADESKKEIDQFVHDNTNDTVNEPAEYRDDTGTLHIVGDTTYYHDRVAVREPLSFTKDEYNTFKSSPEELPMQKRLEISSVLDEIEREKHPETKNGNWFTRLFGLS